MNIKLQVMLSNQIYPVFPNVPMGEHSGTYGGWKRCIEGFGGDVWGKENNWNSYT